MIRFETLKTRFLADTGLFGGGATPALTRALERIGWRAVRDPSPEELASYLLHLLEGCVHEHRDTATLAHGIALALRESGPLLDGGLPPVEAYLPAAEELLRLYVQNDGGGAPAPRIEFPDL
jgi:hypothetical protein